MIVLKNINLYSNDCKFSIDNKGRLYKFCKTNSYEYRKAFFYEYKLMHSLNGNKFFPKYYGYSINKDKPPFIVMEYIKGVTLESILERAQNNYKNSPQIIFPLEILSHICQQIYEAIYILAKKGVLYFDLNPKNIIITNKNFDIKLIDFTHIYIINKNTPWKKIDRRMNPNLPYSLALLNAVQLFFTRLFYFGNIDYNNCFHTENEKSEETLKFFRYNFGILLDFTLCKEQEEIKTIIEEARDLEKSNDFDYLKYLTEWNNRLQNYLKQEINNI